jgi:hypothetical protein
MSPLAISSVLFACIFGVAVAAMLLRRVLPEHHLSADSKEVVKLGMGMIATLAALVLGLLIASAKGTYDAQSNEVKELTANVVLLDRLLATYGTDERCSRSAPQRRGVLPGAHLARRRRPVGEPRAR